jgi:hypothetical protein
MRYRPVHLTRLLRREGLSVPKLIRRASQGDEAALIAWRDETWPAFQVKPGRMAARPLTFFKTPNKTPLPLRPRRGGEANSR